MQIQTVYVTCEKDKQRR